MHPKVGTMTGMNSLGSVDALPDAGAPFRNKARAWAMTAAALLVATVSFLIGIAPYDVEDGQANFIQCGRMVFHAGPRPSPFCDAVPFFWGVIAEVGLFIAACMLGAAIAFAIRSAVGRRANRAFTVSDPMPMSPGTPPGRFVAYLTAGLGRPAVAGRQQRQGLRRHGVGDAGGHEEEPELLSRRANHQ